MLNTLEEIEQHLTIMDNSLSKTLSSGNTNDLYDFNVSFDIVDASLNGTRVKKPTFTGLLHVSPKYYCLLNSFNN